MKLKKHLKTDRSSDPRDGFKTRQKFDLFSQNTWFPCRDKCFHRKM